MGEVRRWLADRGDSDSRWVAQHVAVCFETLRATCNATCVSLRTLLQQLFRIGRSRQLGVNTAAVPNRYADWMITEAERMLGER